MQDMKKEIEYFSKVCSPGKFEKIEEEVKSIKIIDEEIKRINRM